MRRLLLCCLLLIWAPIAAAQVLSLAGSWRWGAVNGIVEIDANGSGKDPAGHTLRWSVQEPASARVFVIRWSHGYTDTVTLATDGNSLTAVNNHGMRFAAQRVGGASPSPAAPGRGGAIAGRWNWGAGGGGVVEILADGSGRDPRGNSLRWTLRDPAARSYVLEWSHGYTDTATLSEDGNSLAAVNNRGSRFTATRVAGTGAPAVPAPAVPQPPAPPPIAATPAAVPVDLNGSWSGRLVHIWQDGSEVWASAAWKRDDGKYVVWRGEGRLQDRTVELSIRYSPMPHGPTPAWRGVFTVSPDGNRIDAVYTLGSSRDQQIYVRDR